MSCPVRRFMALALLPLAAACTHVQEQHGAVVGAVGVARTASEMALIEPQYVAGALIAYAIYDPFAPTWSIRAIRVDDEHIRFEMQMKGLATGGEGEARQVFLRNARQVAEAEGFSGFDVVRWEEGIESSRPFARRVASGEIRLARSQTWPGL